MSTEIETTETSLDDIQELQALQGRIDHDNPLMASLWESACNGDIKPATLKAAIAKQELQTLRASRPTGPDIPSTGGDAPAGSEVMQAALCLSAGMPESFIGDQFGERATNEAIRTAYRGVGLQDACRFVIKAAGQHTGPGFNDETIRSAFNASRQLEASGHSTVSLPGILSNVANKSMLETFLATDVTWSTLGTQQSVNDFKEAEQWRLTAKGKFEPVAKTGELRHMTVQEEGYKNRVDTEGTIFGIGRKDMINDNLMAITSMPQIIGRQGALALERLFYTRQLANKEYDGSTDFYQTGRGNYQEGANTALDETSLQSATTLFERQKDQNGDPIGVPPAILHVPTSLRFTAEKLLASVANLVIRQETEAATARLAPAVNSMVGRYQLVVSPYLDDQGLPGSSAVAWYLHAAPSRIVPWMNVAFLQGRSTPTIESNDMDFHQLGMQMRGYWDFGVQFGDFRGSVKSKGEA